jgi:hypothetical protein
MTADRKKALLFLALTLVIGILIGALVPGFFGRMRREGSRERGRQEQREGRPERRAGFQKMIYKVTGADSAQIKVMQPVLDETSAKIEVLEKASNQRMMGIMDTMKIKLQPLLKEDQMKKLEEFSQKARARRRGR